MAAYSPTSLGIAVPSGGFQTGGWYGGRQYWNGTLGDPGVFHTENNQSGQQGQAWAAPENQTYINQQRTQSNLQPLNYASPAPAPIPRSAPSAPVNTGAGVAYTPPPTIDLQGLYSKLTADMGVTTLQEEFSAKQKAFTEAKAKTDDNPFLSEATRVGRQAKLQRQFDDQTANLLSDIAMKKADVEMQLNLATKQYDINSDAAKTAFNQFQSLLENGALNNASGQDIANITMATGISSSMIQSAIDAQNTKNIKTQTIQYDDGTNQGFAIINEQTGEVINKQVVAASKPKATTSTSTGSTNETLNPQKLYDKYDTQISKVLKEVDAMNVGDEDHLLSAWEQEAAVQRIMALAGVSREVAFDLLEKSMSAGGYGNW